jgi:branched-chain amino acid aminotransferase
MIKIDRRIATQRKPVPPIKDLAFGRHFTDHWFHSRYKEGHGWSDCIIEPYGSLQLEPAAAVLHYGQALFEGMKAFRQEDGSISFFRPEFNFKRMHEGGERLCLQAPPRDIFMDGIREVVAVDEHWVPSDDGASLYIRPTLIGTEGFLGVRPAREVLFFVILSPVGPYYSGGQAPTRIYVEDQALRAAPGGLGATKAGANYAAGLQSAFRAKQKGFDQVLWLDAAHDGVEEVGTMNVFWVFNDEVVTPALNGSILAGGMRDSVLQYLRHQGGTKVSERRVTMVEILNRLQAGELREAFGTGTAAVISPIGELFFKEKSHTINGGKTGELSRSLYDNLTAIQRGHKPDNFGWMVPLSKLT